MQNKITIITKPIENGRTGFSDKINEAIAKLEGKQVRIIIEEYIPKRSDKQNNYYFGVVVPVIQQILFDQTGIEYSIDDTHEFIVFDIWHYTKIKRRVTFNEEKNRYEMASEIVRESSTKLNRKEWQDKMLLCQAWAAGFDKIIPDPTPDGLKEFEQRTQGGLYYGEKL